MKKYSSVIIFLIVSNLILLTFYFTNKNKSEKELQCNIQEVYSLQGENNKWSINGASLIVSSTKQYIDGGVLQYTSKEPLNLRFYEISIVLKDTSNTDILYNTSVSSNFNMNFAKKEQIKIGGIGEPLLKPKEYDFKSKHELYVKIKYTTNENKVYTEQIKLNIEPLNLTYFKNIK